MGGSMTDLEAYALLYAIVPYEQHAQLRAQWLVEQRLKALERRIEEKKEQQHE